MANKLLEGIKDLGYTHDEALDILNEHKKSEATKTEEVEETEEQEQDEDEIENMNDGNEKIDTKIDVEKITHDITENVKKELSAELKKQFKILRKGPPKAKETDDKIGNSPFISKNMYERIV